MLALKNEVKFLKEELIAGHINGSSYTGNCACFIGTIAKGSQCDYQSLLVKPDINSHTERWFISIKTGDTPENSLFAKQTLEWIKEFENLVK